MDVLVLIDKLDDLVHNAKPVPLTDQVRVDKEEIYDILDQMRATIPEEIKQARWIVKERQEMLAEAKKEAERIIKDARERQERLVGEEEVTKLDEARTLLGTGMLHPVRPDKTLRSLVALQRWGPTPAAAYTGSAIRYPDRTAIIDDRGAVTFSEVHKRTNALAHELARAGIAE